MKCKAILFLWLLLGIFFLSESLLAQLQTQIIYLSGTGKDRTVNWDFFCSKGRNSGKWTKIAVPSCWELQGFGNYNYGHDNKLGKPIHDEYGIYRYSFSVPKEWRRKAINIVFDGVMTDAEVKINGKLAGDIHQGAFYQFKYDISNLLSFGSTNQLEVVVNKVSSNKSINYAERNADFWIFGGIFRPVFLEIMPKDHIDQVAIDAKANGELKVELFTSSKKGFSAKLELLGLDGKEFEKLPVIKINKQDGKMTLYSKASNIQTWNPEKPNLYYLQISLCDKNGNPLHLVKERIGFRTIEIRESDGIYVNGVKIKFKGVNRHSFYPETGRTTSKALSLEHARMIKDMNMNAVRMSHYPPDRHFLDVCDSLGLFVINEVCTWHTPYLDTDVGKKIIKEAVLRDVNHPSIILWANGNESGWNPELDIEYSKWDIQQREVIHPWGIFGKTNTMHYSENHIFAYDSPSKDKIYFPTEFLHGLYDGGLGAGLEDYWKVMWNMPLCAGGFLWNFADEAVVRTDKNGILDTDGNHAADGIVGPYGEKEASYFTIKEVWSPIFIADRHIRKDFSGVFEIENRYHYTNLDECSMEAEWVKFDGPNGNTGFSVFKKEKVILPHLVPGEKGIFTVNKFQNWDTLDALYLKAKDPYGRDIFTWSFPLKSPEKLNREIIDCHKSSPVNVNTDDKFIYVTTNNSKFIFNKINGQLKKVFKNGAIIPLQNGPVLLGSKSKLDTVYFTRGANKVEIFALNYKKKKYYDWKENKETTQDFFKWTVNSDGKLHLKVEIRNQKRFEGYMGITFSYPESDIQSMKWLGDGPYRVWRNRMKGTQFNVWENSYNNTITGESGYIYPEFKGFYSNLYWVKFKGKSNNGFTVYCHSPYVFLRVFTPESPSGDVKGRLSPKFPEGDISFVLNIPPIGTKFKDPADLGPQGNMQHIFGNNDEPIKIDLTFEF